MSAFASPPFQPAPQAASAPLEGCCRRMVRVEAASVSTRTTTCFKSNHGLLRPEAADGPSGMVPPQGRNGDARAIVAQQEKVGLNNRQQPYAKARRYSARLRRIAEYIRISIDHACLSQHIVKGLASESYLRISHQQAGWIEHEVKETAQCLIFSYQPRWRG